MTEIVLSRNKETDAMLQYAVEKDVDVYVTVATYPNGSKSYWLIASGDPGEVLYKSPSMESIGARIDMMAVAQLYDQKETKP